MSEEIIPDVEMTSDVVETGVNYAEMNLSELVKSLESLVSDEDRMKKFKEAEAIKTAFYKRLQKEKADAGLEVTATVEDVEADETEAVEAPSEVAVESPFAQIEAGFKELFNKYKKERAEFNRKLEQEREENLKKKQEIINDLKALVEGQDDVSEVFPQFREIQNRWRETGAVPAQNYRNINETYQLYVEQFYDKVKINRELRDLDFRKNLEVKEKFCEEAEALAENPDVVEAFKELQKLHEQWKEYGPVAKEFREQIWDRFKAATAVINKKYQAYFEAQKEKQAENLARKTALCEKVEEIAGREVSDSNQWNAFSKEIEEIQKEWKTIGFASRKENQKIYDRFRAACDKFYARKRDFYAEYKDSINANLEKKISICEQAEALKTSTEWKKTTDLLIELQKQWKEIGAVPRKKSEQLWKRFRAACDEFFAQRDAHAKPENDFYGNLKAKQRLIEEINAYELTGDQDSDREAMQAFMARWQEIGFVPFKEKDNIAQAYKSALQAKFPNQPSRSRRGSRPTAKAPRTEKDKLIQKYNALEQDIVTYENNLGFFAKSKNAEPLIQQMQERIAKAKEELVALAAKIRELGNSEE